jgi:predicted RNA binding protein YcfA (HicA-like mRNA interferase family)
MRKRKLLRRALNSPKNLSFNDLVSLVEAFGFRLDRVSGSHRIYTHPEVAELVNIQDDGGKAKPYQVRQFLKLVEEHDLSIEDEGPTEGDGEEES